MKRKRVEDDEEEAKRKGTERTAARGGKRRVVGRCNPQNQLSHCLVGHPRIF